MRAPQKHANMDALRKSRAWLELAQNACPSQRLLDDRPSQVPGPLCYSHALHTCATRLDAVSSRTSESDDYGNLLRGPQIPQIVGKNVYVCTQALVHTCAHACLWTRRGSIAFIRFSKDL